MNRTDLCNYWNQISHRPAAFRFVHLFKTVAECMTILACSKVLKGVIVIIKHSTVTSDPSYVVLNKTLILVLFNLYLLEELKRLLQISIISKTELLFKSTIIIS